jgi:hypothetical protein
VRVIIKPDIKNLHLPVRNAHILPQWILFLLVLKSDQTKTPYLYGVLDKNKLKLKQTDKSHKVRRG